jgi:hypothetical protein
MDEDLNKEIAKMIGPLPRRRRGRPRTGDAKAWKYTQQYEKLVWAGMKPWQAVQEVAKQYRKTPEHISACRKRFTKIIFLTSRMTYSIVGEKTCFWSGGRTMQTAEILSYTLMTFYIIWATFYLRFFEPSE